MKWDFDGKDDSIEIYENDVVEEIIGEPKDFEVLRFSHEEYEVKNPKRTKTEIIYDFFFYTGNTSVAAITSTTVLDLYKWTNSYLPTFTPTEIYYFNKPFSKSFFKLDFYDSNTPLTQTNYFTVIIPTQQGLTESAIVSPTQPIQQIKKPKFILDFLGDKEGFFFYWLKETNFLDIKTFYMTAKFFNAKAGEFVPMINESQANLSVKYNFTNPADYFYYRVELNYDSKTYKIYKGVNRIGIGVNTIKWFEYVNP